MSTNQRSEISVKNKYWIPKYRYLELKNFCFQYPDWKRSIAELDPLKTHFQKITPGNFSRSVEQLTIQRDRFEQNINLIESTAIETDSFLKQWIIKGVTEGYTYEYLHLHLEMPTSRDIYYDCYRRFFWLLDQKRS